jgi:hypothetical protein
MGKYTILLAINGNFFAEELAISEYNRIADIECDSLDEVFALSQNIGSSWLDNKEVTAIYSKYKEVKKEARSVSVGDLIHSEELDKYYIVEDFGFGEVKIVNGKVVKSNIEIR